MIILGGMDVDDGDLGRLVDEARERGAIIRLWRGSGLVITRVMIRKAPSGFEHIPNVWMSASESETYLREIVP